MKKSWFDSFMDQVDVWIHDGVVKGDKLSGCLGCFFSCFLVPYLVIANYYKRITGKKEKQSGTFSTNS